MILDLTQAEHAVLKQILENKLAALANELAHTDDRSYREYVKGTLEVVEQLQVKVERAPAPGPQPHA